VRSSRNLKCFRLTSVLNASGIILFELFNDHAEGYFSRYEKRDDRVARELIDMINDSFDTKCIRQLSVTYEQNDIDPFLASYS
jgi:hypothetical protein